MRKKTRMFFGMLLAVLFFIGAVSFHSKVYAAELVSSFTVKFMIVDASEKYDGASFIVTFEDIMGEAKEEYEVKKAASWGNASGNIPSISIPAPTTYNIVVSGINKGYKLRDFMTGADIDTSFAATNNGEITFYWEIIEDNGVSTPNKESQSLNTSVDYVVEDEEAESVYAEFLDAVSFIENDNTWASMLDGYEYANVVSYMERMYAACVDNGNKSEEEMYAEYEALSSFDKFLWYATYLQMAIEVHDGHADQVANYDVIAENYSPIFNIMSQERNNHEEVLEAYKKLLHWQADYIAVNGSPFNFINNRSYLQEMGVKDVPSTSEAEEKADEAVEKDLEEIKEVMEEELTDEEIAEITEKPKEKGIWDDTLEILSHNLITLLVLLVLLGALAYVIYLKKKNNYSEEIHEK